MAALQMPILPKVTQTTKVAYSFSASGQLENCKLIETQGFSGNPADAASYGDSFCRAYPKPAVPLIYLGEDGKPTAYTMITTNSTEYKTRPATDDMQSQTMTPHSKPRSAQ